MSSPEFAFSTNGRFLIEFDYATSIERGITDSPTPEELWSRYSERHGLDEVNKRMLLHPSDHRFGKATRHYQDIAINRAIDDIEREWKKLSSARDGGTKPSREPVAEL